jgi:hypothetical protein
MITINNQNTNDYEDLDNPSPEVLEFCRNVVRIIKQDGVWGIPRSGTLFRVDHKKKQLVLLAPGTDDDSDFDATKKVFKHIGWEVVKEHGHKSIE